MDGVADNRKKHRIKWIVTIERINGLELQVRNVNSGLQEYILPIKKNATLEESLLESIGEIDNNNYDIEYSDGNIDL